ncbi:galanin receptor type 2, partial [Camelus ferus]
LAAGGSHRACAICAHLLRGHRGQRTGAGRATARRPGGQHHQPVHPQPGRGRPVFHRVLRALPGHHLHPGRLGVRLAALQSRPLLHLPHHARQQFHAGRCLPGQVSGHPIPAALSRAAHASQRAGGHLVHLGAIAALLRALPELLPPVEAGQPDRVPPGVERASPPRHGPLHFCLQLRAPRAGARPDVRAHPALPLARRRPGGRQLGRPAGQAQGDAYDHHRGRTLLPLLDASPHAYPLRVVRPLPSYARHLRAAYPLAPSLLRQLLRQPHRLRSGLQALPQGLPQDLCGLAAPRPAQSLWPRVRRGPGRPRQQRVGARVHRPNARERGGRALFPCTGASQRPALEPGPQPVLRDQNARKGIL